MESLGPAYRIETERLVLRCYDIADRVAVDAVIRENLEHLREWMPSWANAEPLMEDERIALLRKMRGTFDLETDFVYGIFDRAGAFVGGCGLHPRIGPDATEIGYWIDRRHVGKGWITEAAGALTRVAIELQGIERVEIRCDPNNVRSAAVPRRLGYTCDGTLRRRMKLPDGRERATQIWSLFHDELLGTAASSVEYVARDAAGREIDPLRRA